MRMALWQHPKRKTLRRVYINGMPGVPRENKLYFEPIGRSRIGIRLVAGDWHEHALEQLFEAGILDSAADLAGMSLEDVVEASEKEPAAPPPARATRGPAHRDAEVAALDPRTIPVPDPVTIRVDHREPPELFDALAGIPNVEIERAELPMGDIEINGSIVIERKSCRGNSDGHTDFEASVIGEDKRLFTQSEKMRLAEGCLPIFILEGEPHQSQQAMTPQQVDGAISFLVTVQRLNVITTYSVHHTAYVLVKLATHDRSGLGYVPPLRGKKPAGQKERLAFVLEGLPGLSGAFAQRIASQYDTLAEVVNASDEELLSIEGIGPKRLADMRRVLGGG
ncbi:ERCC4 domain-containing protein [Thioalkalivibrio sp. ALE23]|uniref:ERCC4 domain-containing protein n=1 Tax=Thioalkalivibrio sp. ALE23 TaxID=1265495 RepID=UPI0003AAAFE7|nr:ERCC4 domain-containing protein [Thioalkalivibrio sp. ALE23]